MTTFSQRLLQQYQEATEFPIIHLLHNREPEQSISYRKLIQGATGYTQALREAGIQPGQVVILILQHGEALIYAFFGAILHGAVPSIMPFLTEKLSPEQYRRSLSSLFEITAPDAVITYAEFVNEVHQAMPANRALPVLISDAIQPIVDPDVNNLGGLNSQAEDIVLLQHSSGTTGLQKGVALSHRAVFNQLHSYLRALDLNARDVIVSWLPLYHDMGLIAGFILPILSRTPLVLMSPFDWVRAPYKLMQAISQYRGTLAWLPNFAYNFCAQKIRDRHLEGVDLSSWRAVINCSEPMYWRSHRLFLERFQPYGLKQRALATCYAMAENVFAVSQGGIDAPITVDCIAKDTYLTERIARPAHGEEASINMLSAGRPISNTQVHILDDKRCEVAERHIGEIALFSDCMLSGYYNRPDLTEKAFHAGWYLTGDLGYLADGELYVTGRKKDLIIVGGKNVYPQDLEALAGEVPGVHAGRVVAFGITNEESGTEDVVIVAEVDEGESEHPAQDIADGIRQHVTQGSDIALRYVKIVKRGWLLKTSSGKVARSANRDKYLQEG